MEHEKRFSYGQLGIGIFLLLMGVGLLLSRLDIIGNVPFWKFWPVIPIAMGIGKLIDASTREQYQKAFWMLTIGGWFLVNELHLFGLHYHNSWPVLLIAIGIGILWKSTNPSRTHINKDCCDGK
jgi:hypothetical protein